MPLIMRNSLDILLAIKYFRPDPGLERLLAPELEQREDVRFSDKFGAEGLLVIADKRLEYFQLKELLGFSGKKRDNASAAPLALP